MKEKLHNFLIDKTFLGMKVWQLILIAIIIVICTLIIKLLYRFIIGCIVFFVVMISSILINLTPVA